MHKQTSKLQSKEVDAVVEDTEEEEEEEGEQVVLMDLN
jgi:hypothetical protein